MIPFGSDASGMAFDQTFVVVIINATKTIFNKLYTLCKKEIERNQNINSIALSSAQHKLRALILTLPRNRKTKFARNKSITKTNNNKRYSPWFPFLRAFAFIFISLRVLLYLYSIFDNWHTSLTFPQRF